MTTVRQIERHWKSGSRGKLLRELLGNRPESSAQLEADLRSLVAAAALAMIRLEELHQTHVPLYSKLLLTVIASQDPDGGWRDPLTTALCVRALLIDQGRGESIDRGIAYLAAMQKTEGIWPKLPIRRLQSDVFTSAYVLFQLSTHERFRRGVRFDDAMDWFESHEHELDEDTRRLWQYVAATGLARPRTRAAPLWS
jgi:hypothetical protein